MKKYEFAHHVALVTGAAGGIGASLSRALGDRGSLLALVDVDADRLEDVAAQVRRAHPSLAVHAYPLDLTDDAAVESMVQQVHADLGRVHLLVNNAGVALGGRFDQVSPDDVDWVMAVNFRAPMRLTHLLLPDLLAQPGSHVVMMSSLFGLVAPAGQVAYSASKFAVRGLAEALRHELPPQGVGVTCVHPGGVRTSIAQNARIGSKVSAQEHAEHREVWERLLRMDPDDAAGTILRGVERRQGRVLVGWDARTPDLLGRLFPGSYGTFLSGASALAERLP